MRVLYVVHGFPPEERAGTELHTEAVARRLEKLGHETFVFAASRRLPAGETAPLEGREGLRVGVRLGADSTLSVRNPEARRALEAYLDEVQPDVVHVQHLLFLGADAIEAVKARGIPVVVSLHDAWFQCPAVHLGPRDHHPLPGPAWGLACFWHHGRPGLLGTASLARRGVLGSEVRRYLARPHVLRRQLRAADAVLVPSKFLRRSFMRFGVAGGRIRVLPHPAEPVTVVPRAPARPISFGFVGSLATHKGVEVLCEAFARTGGDATLTLYGRCQDPALLERLKPYFGERIRYAGEFDRSRLEDVYGSLDVVVVPSLVQESFSLAAQEARSFGRPVIASRIGALPELVVHGEDGVLVPPGDVGTLAAALERLSDPDEVTRLGAAAPVSLGPEEHARLLERLYRRLDARAAAAPVASRT